MNFEIRILRGGDGDVLSRVAPGVFDQAVDEKWSVEFLNDARHHLAVALDDGVVVGMATAVNYVNSDKPPELWINEVGVAPTHQKRGIGKALLQALLDAGRVLGCREAWLLTERSNSAAMALYESVGGEKAKSDQVMFTFRIQELQE